jgi:hypothetical protein
LNQTDENSTPLPECFAERSNLVFSQFFRRFEFAHDEELKSDSPNNDRAWSLQTVHCPASRRLLAHAAPPASGQWVSLGVGGCFYSSRLN